MPFRPKPLSEQVLVITGATSGIGLSTARAAARRGARLVLCARSAQALETLCAELRARGCEAVGVAADVGSRKDMEDLAARAHERFGRVDAWINNAGAGIFGRVTEVSPADRARLFDTVYWGVVHGSLAAMPLLKAQGGILINVGSAFADRAAPLHGYYSAAKHAVKAWTEALRMELEQAGEAVEVCLVTPAAIDTMFSVHARNYLDRIPKLPPPQYAPETVARAILFLTEHPRREMRVGSTARMLAIGSRLSPRLVDRMMELLMFRLQKTSMPASSGGPDALYQPRDELQERSGRTALVREYSFYNAIARHRGAALLAGAALIGGSLWAARRRRLPVPSAGIQ
ncbi:SDR family oxidoreductase [Noviherbaspirillum aridicola]|uniref:Glucose 1-dehydrogenase n=1 Tax=Noviherbaspirillum aridicola TaxID=2849687 RepID=A0ABQ4Q0J7_9BURK|nr:SDR family oxidoreductase [Noviherbaspirillum aridicola]GIZ50686.1 glucose 1-dehydrogenase [Noviherbaspirillum aridicola]